MYTYISLLRGINVSGQKRLLMPEPKTFYETFGFRQVITYVQSGNVIFDSPQVNRPEICAQAEKLLSNLDTSAGMADEFIATGIEIYLHVPGGYGQTFLSNNLFDQKLDRVATTRNWKTVNTLFDLASKSD